MQARFREIESAVADGTYRVGAWQQLLEQVSDLPVSEQEALEEDLSRVSRVLHRRHGFAEVPFELGFLFEGGLLVSSALLLAIHHLVTALIGAACLTLCLQPLLKVCTGIALGVRYDYAYLWYFEPRFKMQFGTYFTLGRPAKVVLHLMGSIGTPLALWVASLGLSSHAAWLGWLALAGAGLAAFMQVGAFAAEWVGVRKVGPFRLSQLTSPATAAMELKRFLSGDPSQV